MHPVFSLIIPCYRVERYIRKCLDSILDQSFQSWEALLINDGSPDCSGEICAEYAKKDPRFRFFHKENGGVSSARNLGLDKACGEWIWYIDPDDWIARDALCVLARYIQDFNVDAIVFGMQFELDTGEILGNDAKLFKFGHVDEVIELFDYGPPSVLQRRKILEDKHLRFSIGIRMYEDLELQYKYLMSCTTILQVPDILYYVLRHEGSAVQNSKSIQNAAEDIPKVLGHLVAFISGNRVQEKDWIAARINRTFKSAMYMNAIAQNSNSKDVQCVIFQADKQLYNLGYKKYRDAAVLIGRYNIQLYYYLIKLRELIKRIK